MKDDTEEESLENDSDTINKKVATEVVSREENNIDNKNIEVKSMEVHHHSHPHHEGKKTWKAYFWEFLMLFLAVFCGFLAEYQLEHVIERQKAKEYIFTIYDDLKIDNKQLQTLIPQFKEKDKELSEMLSKIKNITPSNGANGLYAYIHVVANYPDFIYTDRTIQQLKNSGGLRLITDKEVSDKIIGYDASVKIMNIHIAEEIGDQIHVVRQMNTKIFDMRCCPELGDSVPLSTINYPTPGKLLTTDEKIIVEYFNNVQEMKRNFTIQRGILEKLLIENNELQEFLNNKYHIE